MSAARWSLWAAVLLLTACLPGAPPTPVTEEATLLALAKDARVVELRTAPSSAAGIGAAQAVRRATESLGDRAKARTDPQARLVRLSVRRDDDGQMVVDGRPVWLVTFPGVVFETEACACTGLPTNPSTAVAVDAGDGAIVAAFGVYP